ncbi:hypothetical protein CDAR_196841 [Caerostris darwini]|uniref:Uncharacterized protein n=1 Tax=Caerostris darwini TaxID=1538125 RepID=A0AAV4PWQ2_9ARAC|nr:hypothetical protein CDAR_196841 [Caerostris darwini]
MASTSKIKSSLKMLPMPVRFYESEPLLRTSNHPSYQRIESINGEKTRFRMSGPDGCRSWMIAFSAFFINMITAGIGRNFSILFVEIMEEFHVNRELASLPFSVLLVMRFLLGPIVGILGLKYDVRTITLLGGVVSTASTIACFFATDIYWIVVNYGVINGFGVCLSTTLLQVSIREYFEVHRATAMGLAFSGGCMGSLIFPMLLEYIVITFGVRKDFLVNGIFLALTIPISLVFKKPPWLENKQDRKESEKLSENSTHEYTNSTVTNATLQDNPFGVVDCQGKNRIHKSVSILGKEITTNPPDIQTLRQQSETVVAILQSVPPDLEQIKHELGPDLSGLSHGSHIWFGLEILCQSVEETLKKFNVHKNLNLSKTNFFCDTFQITGLKSTTGKIALHELLCKPYLESSHKFEINSVSQEYSKELILLKLKEFQDIDVPDILSLCSNENKNSVLNISMELKRLFRTFSQLERSQNGIIPMTTVQQTTVPVKKFSRKMSFRENFKNTFKLFWTYSKIACSLYKKPIFLLICICRTIHFITFVPVLTTVEDFIMEKGLSQYDGQYAVIALSTGDLLGRLALGWVTDYGFLSLPRFMLLTMVLQSISTVTLPLMNTKVLIYVALGVFGMFQGTLFVRHSVLVSKYMENHEQSVGMGCFGFFSGMFGLGLSKYVGFFKDQVGNYDFMLYISGSIGALVGLLWIFEPYFISENIEDEENEPV